MRVSDALELMARNPAVDFAWEKAVVDLINSFLPDDSLLDSKVVTIDQINVVLSDLDDATREMIYNASINSVLGYHHMERDDVEQNRKGQYLKLSRQAVFTMFGLVVCVIALMMASNVGNGVEGTDVVEIVKLLLQTFSVAL